MKDSELNALRSLVISIQGLAATAQALLDQAAGIVADEDPEDPAMVPDPHTPRYFGDDTRDT
jgi:hypothetical protein